MRRWRVEIIVRQRLQLASFDDTLVAAKPAEFEANGVRRQALIAVERSYLQLRSGAATLSA